MRMERAAIATPLQELSYSGRKLVQNQQPSCRNLISKMADIRDRYRGEMHENIFFFFTLDLNPRANEEQRVHPTLVYACFGCMSLIMS